MFFFSRLKRQPTVAPAAGACVAAATACAAPERWHTVLKSVALHDLLDMRAYLTADPAPGDARESGEVGAPAGTMIEEEEDDFDYDDDEEVFDEDFDEQDEDADASEEFDEDEDEDDEDSFDEDEFGDDEDEDDDADDDFDDEDEDDWDEDD